MGGRDEKCLGLAQSEGLTDWQAQHVDYPRSGERKLPIIARQCCGWRSPSVHLHREPETPGSLTQMKRQQYRTVNLRQRNQKRRLVGPPAAWGKYTRLKKGARVATRCPGLIKPKDGSSTAAFLFRDETLILHSQLPLAFGRTCTALVCLLANNDIELVRLCCGL
jgi:hypothetical protein